MKTTKFTILNIRITIPIWTYPILGFFIFASIMTNIKPLFYLITYLLIIVMHEVGHALVAKVLKYKVEAIFLTPLFGTCEVEEPYYAYEHQLIASAGIIVQLMILLTSILLVAFFNEIFDPILIDVLKVVCIGFNSALIIFNLLPFEPLDGYHIWKLILRPITSNRFVKPEKNKTTKVRKNTDMEKLMAEITKKMNE